MPRAGERGQGAGPQDAGPWGRMWPSLSQSGPTACQLASGASLGTAGASGHLLQAVPRVPPGTSGQSSITPATSVVPRGVNLEDPSVMGLISTVGRAFTVSLRTGRSWAARGAPLAPAGPPEELEPHTPSSALQATVPEVGTFLQTCLEIPRALGHEVAALIKETSLPQRKRTQV